MTKRAMLALLPFVVALAACAQDSRWERSRGEYCQEVELLANRTLQGVASLESTLRTAAEPDRLREGCARAHVELREVGALLTGVGVATGALARARSDDQSLDAAGFHMIRADVAQKFDPQACASGPNEKSANEVAAIKAALEKEFSQALERCHTAGWKSSLADSRYR